RKRRERGVRPIAECLSRTKPWEAESMSRRTWYRRRRGTGAKPAISPLKSGGTSGTSRKPAILSLGRRTVVPPERKQRAFRGGACPKNTVQTPSPSSLLVYRHHECDRRHFEAGSDDGAGIEGMRRRPI